VRRSTTKEFVAKARKVHGDRFDYAQTEYQNSSTPVVIVCQRHGAFSQIPDNHLAGKGCKECAGNQHHPVEETIRRLRGIHDGFYLYDLSTFTNTKQRLHVTCIVHGPFTVAYYKHLKGAGCPQCTGHYHHQAKRHFVGRARAVHGQKYRYGKYTGAAKKMRITCPAHGAFLQTPASHLQGHGCKECADDRKRQLAKGGYSEEFFQLHPEMKHRPAILYLVEFSRPGESFLKIGITRTSVASRLKSGYRKYFWRILVSKPFPLYQAFGLEQKVLQKFKSYQVYPKQDTFVGKTECLSPSCAAEVQLWLQDIEDGFITKAA
jgi:hypothetical protein